MEITISTESKRLLDILRKSQMDIWEQNGRKDIASIWKQYDYNDLIMALHLGFSEKAFYESMRGFVVTQPNRLTSNQIDEVKRGMLDLIRGV